MYLLISASSRLWRFRYRWQGKENTLSLGAYPEISLAEARKLRDDYRTLLAKGINPADVRRAEKARAKTLAEDTFEAVAREWIARYLATKAESHRKRVIRRLEKEVFPYLGRRPVAEITAPEIRSAPSRGAGAH